MKSAIIFACLAFAIICLNAQTLDTATVTVVATVPTNTEFNQGTQGTQGNQGTQGTGAGGAVVGNANETSANITEQVANFEKSYLNYILNHHYIGLRASALCLESTRNVRPTLRQLCRYINATERAQFDILNDLNQFYFQTSFQPPSLNASGSTGASGSSNTSDLAFWNDQLAGLQNTTNDDEFQAKFLRWLVLYQGSAIIASTPCAQSSFHKELIDFCISEIQNEAAQMGQVRALLCAWYNVCQIELTPAEVKAQQDALNAVTLGLAASEQPVSTELATSTELNTLTATEIGTQVAATFTVPGTAA